MVSTRHPGLTSHNSTTCQRIPRSTAIVIRTSKLQHCRDHDHHLRLTSRFTHRLGFQSRRGCRRARIVPASAAAVAVAGAPTALANAGWPLWTCVALVGALSQVIEQRTAAGLVLSAPLLATLLALGAAASGIIPSASPVYSVIWTYLLPLAAALYLLECDITGLVSTAGSAVMAFFNGALGTVLGTIVGYALLGPHLGPDGAKVAAALCASYIGGSVNFAAVAGLFNLSAGSVLAAAMTADNIAMAVYLAVLYLIPATMPAAAKGGASAAGEQPRPVSAESVAVAIAAAALACALGNAAAAAAGFASGGLAFAAVAASAFAALGSALTRRQDDTPLAAAASPFAGAQALGGALMLLFFATIGAAAGSVGALRGSGALLAFIFIQLSVQLGVALALGKLMRLPTAVVLVAANANVGGPATAAAMAAGKGWPALVQPALLTGSLGYAVANGVGWAMGSWMQTWFLV